jgi:hypothetical protein
MPQYITYVKISHYRADVALDGVSNLLLRWQHLLQRHGIISLLYRA